ncbi:hypothetical protein AS061_14525 [Listeria monocytogenes]|nr:hypothetical protein [Listeria monocytogenes]
MDKTELNKLRLELEEEIEALGYQTLRYSLFNPEKEYREEWQWRIEYENGKYLIYGLEDRASILGRKFEFDDFSLAKSEFINRLEYMVRSNKRRIENGEFPNYSSPLWNKQ